MFRFLTLLVILLISSDFLLSQKVNAAPIGDNIIKSYIETKESNKEVNDHRPDDKTKSQNLQNSLPHEYEETTASSIKLAKEPSLKYDVEILESRPIKTEDNEIEERFRGPALEVQTNNFYAENIEVNSIDKETGLMGGIRRHEQLVIILASVGLLSVVLYALLLVWRSHQHRRYGMRELLLATGNNYYEPNNNLNNNNHNNVYNTTTQNLVPGQ